MDELELARKRTQEFIDLTAQELQKMGFGVDIEPIIMIMQRQLLDFQTPEEHYEVREQIAGAFSSAAYKYLTRKFKEMDK